MKIIQNIYINLIQLKIRIYKQAYIKERIDDHIKWYGATAGQYDHIWPVRSQLTYITFQ
jgi:hypothetical protein